MTFVDSAGPLLVPRVGESRTADSALRSHVREATFPCATCCFLRMGRTRDHRQGPIRFSRLSGPSSKEKAMTVTKTQLADAYSKALTEELCDEWDCDFSRRDASRFLDILWPVVSELALKDTKKRTPGSACRSAISAASTSPSRHSRSPGARPSGRGSRTGTRQTDPRRHRP